MNANTNMDVSRRELMVSAGALVFAFSVAEPGTLLAQTQVMATAGDGKGSLAPTELELMARDCAGRQSDGVLRQDRWRAGH